MKKTIFLLIFLFSIPIVSASVRINEVMYNPAPELGGTYNEWIELYNSGDNPVDLSGWNMSELSGGVAKFHPIQNGTIVPNGFLILARNNTKFNDYFNVNCPVIKISFGYGLNNDGDNISITNSNNELVDFASYDGSFANGNNNSLQFKDGKWCEGIPTPGSENICEQASNDTKNTTLNNDSVNGGISNDSEEPQQIEENQSQNEFANNTNTSKENKTISAQKENTTKSLLNDKTPINTVGITGKTIYESKNEKIKMMSMELLLLLLIAAVIYSIVKKEK